MGFRVSVPVNRPGDAMRAHAGAAAMSRRRDTDEETSMHGFETKRIVNLAALPLAPRSTAATAAALRAGWLALAIVAALTLAPARPALAQPAADSAASAAAPAKPEPGTGKVANLTVGDDSVLVEMDGVDPDGTYEVIRDGHPLDITLKPNTFFKREGRSYWMMTLTPPENKRFLQKDDVVRAAAAVATPAASDDAVAPTPTAGPEKTEGAFAPRSRTDSASRTPRAAKPSSPPTRAQANRSPFGGESAAPAGPADDNAIPALARRPRRSAAPGVSPFAGSAPIPIAPPASLDTSGDYTILQFGRKAGTEVFYRRTEATETTTGAISGVAMPSGAAPPAMKMSATYTQDLILRVESIVGAAAAAAPGKTDSFMAFPEGTANASVEYGEAQYAMDMAGMKVTVDTREPAGGGAKRGPMAQAEGALRQMLEANRGKAVEARIYSAPGKTPGEKNLPNSSLMWIGFEDGDKNPQIQQLSQALGGSLSKQGREDMVDLPLLRRMLPGKLVKPGDSWKDFEVKEVPALGKLESHTTYTFAGWNRTATPPLAVVRVTGTLETSKLTGSNDKASAELAAAGVEVKLKPGTFTGSIQIEPESGLVRVAEFTVPTEAEMQVPNPMQQNGKQISMTLKSTARVTLEAVDMPGTGGPGAPPNGPDAAPPAAAGSNPFAPADNAPGAGTSSAPRNPFAGSPAPSGAENPASPAPPARGKSPFEN